MSDARSATTVKVPTARLLRAVVAAMEAWQGERRAMVDKAVGQDMEGPIPHTWWERTFNRHPAKTRDEAIARLKVPPDIGWSRWDEIWLDRDGAWGKLTALRDACELRLDHVDVSVDDVQLFKAHYETGEVYR